MSKRIASPAVLWPSAARAFFAGFALVVLVAGCTTAPTEYHEPAPLTAEARSAHNLATFDKAWSLVNEKYFDPKFRGVDWTAQSLKYRPEAAAATDDDALYRVINRMFADLKESHLFALSPRRAYEMTSAHRAAVGLFMQLIDGRRIVSQVLPGSPAEAAGIKPGWIVVSRNGIPYSETPVRDTFVARLGDPVQFSFLDEHDQPREITLQPRLLSFGQRVSRVLSDGTLYLRFDVFDRDSLSWLSDQLKLHRAAPAAVIDLRQNPGGRLLALKVAEAEFFDRRVETGRFVFRNGREYEGHSLSWFSARYAGRVAVLTGLRSSSCSEIFAHVLQHNHRAIIVGRKTAGSVIASRRYPLPNGGKLQVPVKDYIGLDGHRLEGRGVTPDVEVPLTLANLRAGIDADLDAALTELKKPASEPKP